MAPGHMDISVRTELLERLLNATVDPGARYALGFRNAAGDEMVCVRILVGPGGYNLWFRAGERRMWYVPPGKTHIIRGWCAGIIQRAWRRRRCPMSKARAALVAADDAMWDHCLSGGALALPWDLLDRILRHRMRLMAEG